MFPDDGGLRTLRLVSTATGPTGVNVCVYRRAAGIQGRRGTSQRCPVFSS